MYFVMLCALSDLRIKASCLFIFTYALGELELDLYFINALDSECSFQPSSQVSPTKGPYWPCLLIIVTIRPAVFLTYLYVTT
jgi:hypothetical protein